jgi:hypothetical protein
VIDDETAAVLAAATKWDGRLLHVSALTVRSARALAGANGNTLNLSGLRRLDRDVADALAGFAGTTLAVRGLTALDAPTADALVAIPSWDGRLPCLTAFSAPDSVAVAKALATRKGQLALPNLRKISPKTLTALLEKQDVEIPLIETLELIPEPDGSTTEDFVIPEDFAERQKRRR